MHLYDWTGVYTCRLRRSDEMEQRSGFLCLLVCLLVAGCRGLEFGHTYGSHMVLQRAPQRAMLYGYADVLGDTVTVTLNGHQVGTAAVHRSTVNGTSVGYWDMLLPAESRHGPFTLVAYCKDGSKTLTDVMFGDVWLCSGQSNMQFGMRQVNNSAAEIQDALTRTDVRILMSRTVASDTEQSEATIQIPWEPPRKGIVDYFSAVCFMFGRDLQSRLNYPIGLIETSWGGTRIQAWSSPDSLATCTRDQGKRAANSSTPSGLFNAMVKPFLRTTIKGAIWYQGESNGPQGYDCMFPEMIADWRDKFHHETKGQTDPEFPFGFVQIGTYKNLTNGFGFTGTRWAQTADYGYAPNPQMHNTFMAVALDLPDTTSPWGEVHPRYKQDVAARLTLGARAVAYGESGVVFQGPFPSGYHLDPHHRILDISFDQGRANLIFHNTTGFEICCGSSASADCHGNWEYTTVVAADRSEVKLRASCSHAGYQVIGIRYLWRITPCALKMCPLYGTTNYLPVPPFIKTGGFPTTSTLVG